MFIITEEALTQLICSVCFKYLSVQPIKLYGGKIVKCGRCTRDNDDGAVSIFNYIITNALFPCVNRYEGCNQLMNHLEVAAHEKVCVSRTYECPICTSENEYTSLQLLQHYRNSHATDILKMPVIVTNGEKEFENYYMYKENNFIFIIYVQCSLSEKCFFLTVACLGPKERAAGIQQYVRCYLNYDEDSERLFFQTQKHSCSIFWNKAKSFKISFPSEKKLYTLIFYIDTSSVVTLNYTESNISAANEIKTENIALHNRYPKIYLSAQYKEKYPYHYLSPCGTKVFDIYRNEIYPRICEFCENTFPLFYSQIFKCNFNHYYCYKCHEFNRCCLENHKLECFESSSYPLLYFYCRWNCRKFYSSAELIEHEDHCEENVDSGYTYTELAQKHFSSYSSKNKNHLVSRSNFFSFQHCDFLDNQKVTVFVITRDGFKLILHISYEDRTLDFSVVHDYASNKYHILFKIKEAEDEISRRINSFSIVLNPGNVISFAVLLRQTS